jgi:hypothetical protein
MRERIIAYKNPELKALKRKHEEKVFFFLHRSISIKWFQRLIRLGTCPIRVGLILRFKMILEGKDTIILTTSGLSAFSVSRQQKWKGLNALKEEGLIRIESRRGKNPMVTVIDPPADRTEER